MCLAFRLALGDRQSILARMLQCALQGLVILCLLPAAISEHGLAAMLEVSTGEPSSNAIRLVGSRDRRQLVVTQIPDGSETAFDVTGVTVWRVEPPSLAEVRPGGLVVPLADGQGTIVAGVLGEKEVRVRLSVERFGADPPIDFVSQIVPIFTKYGCNGGGCHGKSGGQNGFRLSLLGF